MGRGVLRARSAAVAGPPMSNAIGEADANKAPKATDFFIAIPPIQALNVTHGTLRVCDLRATLGLETLTSWPRWRLIRKTAESSQKSCNEIRFANELTRFLH